jgi:hypothetical protein
MVSNTWWLRVHAPLEIKAGTDDKDVLRAAKQLHGYLQQVLKAQMDRRFALGFVFCGIRLSVWLCDRSGLLGTMRSIDVHKVSPLYLCLLFWMTSIAHGPKKFILCHIASLSLLAPERLGWDNHGTESPMMSHRAANLSSIHMTQALGSRTTLLWRAQRAGPLTCLVKTTKAGIPSLQFALSVLRE